MFARKPRFPLFVGFVVAAAAIGAFNLASKAVAQSQDTNEPVYLGNNKQVQDDRIQLLREEFRERQREIREDVERARLGKSAKRVHGRKAVPAPGQDDLYTGSGFNRAASPDRVQVAPTNVKANDKTGDAANAGQAEQHIAFLGQKALCAWNDGQGFNLTPQDVQGYGYSTDGGATWTDGGIPAKTAAITTWSSDPSVSVNEKTGDFYYVGLTTNPSSTNGLAVARGHFSGASFIWDAETVVASGPNASQAFDKEWMCADSLTGNLYVTWTLFTTTGDGIFFSRSTDNGATWSAPLQISGSWENGFVSGSRPAVGPNGEVYVTYSEIGPVDADSIKIAKSTNNGASFTPAVVSGLVYDNYFDGAPGFNRPRAVTFPSIAVDRSTGPNRGRVYESWQDCVDFYLDPLGGGTSKSEVENNGGFANATPFTVGQVLRGSLASTSDQDWWSFPATQGTTYIFYVDSLRTTSMRYTMRLYCPNDTTVLSRLGFSGAQATNSALGSHSLIVWTAPTTNTYYLRMVPVTVGTGTNPYRIQTGVHSVFVNDVARDTRDAMVVSSADGQTGWSPRIRVNDDAPLYDNWLPEVAVPCDGKAYAMWFDWRDTPASCFGGSNIYVSRSTDGGATWAPNQVATTAVTANWTQVLSNIAPNQGDYNGMYGGDCVGLAFADGRLGDADVFTARIATNYTLTPECPGDQVVIAGTTFSRTLTINNLNQMFGNDYTYTLTVDHNWPGYPASGTVSAAALGSVNFNAAFPVPDSAANNENVRACITVSQNGACVMQCCFTITVLQGVVPVLASVANQSVEDGHVRISWLVTGGGTVNVYRSQDGTSWNTIGQYVADVGSMVRIDDANVQPGAQYEYRLGIPSGGTEVYAAQTSIRVPAAEFALNRVYPNPTTAGFSVVFSLPTQAHAMLEVFDLSGRAVWSREVGALGAGQHTVALEAGRRLPIGVYNVRLTQGSHTAKAKVSVVR